MKPFSILAVTMLLATTSLALTPTAAAIECERIETVEDVRECRDEVEDSVIRIVGTVLYEACHRVDPQRCP